MAIQILPRREGIFDNPILQLAMKDWLEREQQKQQQPYEIQKALISGGMAQPFTPQMTQGAPLPIPQVQEKWSGMTQQPTMPSIPSSMPYLQKAQSQYTRPDFTAGNIPFQYMPNIENKLKEAQLGKAQAEAEQIRSFMGGGTGAPAGFRPKSVDVGALTYERVPTEEEKQREAQADIDKQVGVQVGKKITEERASAAAGKALINEIHDLWIETTPTRVTNEGKFSLVGAGKAVISPGYGVEQWLGSRFGVTENQRKDKAYIKFVNSLRSRLAKGAIGNDVGNLSEYEQRVVVEGVPSAIFDSYESGTLIINNLNKVIDKMKEARIQGYANLNEKMKAQGVQPLSKEEAMSYLQKAGGNKEKARSMAIRDGRIF